MWFQLFICWIIGYQVQGYADLLELLYKGQEIDTAAINLGTDEEANTETKSRNLDTEFENVNPATQTLTGGTLDAIKGLLKRFMDDIPKTKCENCKANVPALRSEGVGKIFQVPIDLFFIP